jgi:REP element-mobilizing transposase RayT
MARPLRIEFAGALYHVTSRGDGQEDIYLDDTDRDIYLEVLADVQHRFNWTIHAYCLMSNHYHLLIETPDSDKRGSGLVLCLFPMLVSGNGETPKGKIGTP